MKPNRRRFLSLLGVSAAAGPLAAKAAVDAQTLGLVSPNMHSLAATGMGLGAGMPAEIGSQTMGGNGPYLSHAEKLINASNYIKFVGVPEVVEAELRDQSKWIGTMDPDIACKRSWSMSVKILAQRERNYQRAIERMKRTGWQQQKRSALRTLLGFEWPF